MCDVCTFGQLFRAEKDKSTHNHSYVHLPANLELNI